MGLAALLILSGTLWGALCPGAAACGLGLSGPAAALVPVNTYLGNQRVRVDPRAPPYNAVWKLYRYDGGVPYECNAVMTENPHIFVTAAHCVLEPVREALGQVVYRTARKLIAVYGLDGGRAGGREFRPRIFHVGTHDPYGWDQKDDCAVLYEPEAIPRGIQPFAIDPGGKCDPAAASFEAIGYSRDPQAEHGLALMHERSCKAHAEYLMEFQLHMATDATRLIFEQCSGTDGSSGMALLCRGRDGKTYLAGLQTQQITPPGNHEHLDLRIGPSTTNVGVRIAACYDKVRELKALIQRGAPVAAAQ
jgi:hypothetical protein